MAETEERSLDKLLRQEGQEEEKERSNRARAPRVAPAGAVEPRRWREQRSRGLGWRWRPAGDGGTAGVGPARRQRDRGRRHQGRDEALIDQTVHVLQDEDEWKEFEQKEVDYSGLRVQAMQISEKEEDENDKREDPGDNWEEGGGGGGGVEKSSGPWNKTAAVPAPPAPVVVTETPEPTMTSGVYRPPGARLTTTRKTPQGPPEIYSDTQFPSLQSTAKHVESRKDKEMEKSFEVVRHKTRGRDEVSKNQALKLQLDNQYAVLENQKCSHTQYN
ncbi:Protein CDV3-like protein [Camelus dromedarius]|uniref:Protein CDV3-like protein n=2 Tax=Camelus dromedarius TaxID=9838 RepID=A0A5N4EJE5_CAMDR|nr:Protein CDV3-like protein [Camelus dromedarius]